MPATIARDIHWVGAADPQRVVFDALMPLPGGTSYNAYLIKGSRRTALLDSVDPDRRETLFRNLEGLGPVDYVISHHAEQDHSGSLPFVLERFPEAKLVCTPKAVKMLSDLMPIATERFMTVNDGDTLDLGDRTLRFLHFPWVHWPETMVSLLEQDRILFSGDLFGAHLAPTDPYMDDSTAVLKAARIYFAEIMMPFSKQIRKYIEIVDSLDLTQIAPSHGPVHRNPAMILDAYCAWTSETPGLKVLIPYVSMHGSTKAMVAHLAMRLREKGLSVSTVSLEQPDLSVLAWELVDARTLVAGCAVAMNSLHPNMIYVMAIVNGLKPPIQHAALIGSYGWSPKAFGQLADWLPDLKAEALDAVTCKGYPRAADLANLDALADAIAVRHAE